MNCCKLSKESLLSLLKTIPEGQIFVLVDTNSAEYCLPVLEDITGDIVYHTLTIQDGECNKNISTVQVIWNFLFKNYATRQAILINLGGGMVTDIGGFAAATYMRGIGFINIPTTLLAMVDAASGGKTGFDYQGMKNGIGTFTNAISTFIYPDFLYTLPNREILSGFAEMLKHALIADKAEWVRLLQMAEEDLSEKQFIQNIANSNALQVSIDIKQQIVSGDPLESGLRKVLNFGHTIGHAIESASLDNKAQAHGYCVLWGMVAEVYLSVVHAGCPREVLQHLTRIMLQWYGRPECNCKQRDELIARMYHDKKNNARKTPNFTLLEDIGKPIINQQLTEKDINEALEYLFSL